MKPHFNPNQHFKHDSTNSIVSIFEDRPFNRGDTFGGLSDEVIKVQKPKTIDEHFLKES